MAATRPSIDDLRDWLNTGWGHPDGGLPDTEPGELDPHDPLLPSLAPPRGRDHNHPVRRERTR